MKLKISSQRIGDSQAQMLLVPVYNDSDFKKVFSDLDEITGNMFSMIIGQLKTAGDQGEITVLPFGDKKVLVLGLGCRAVTRQEMRDCFGKLGRMLRKMQAESVSLDTVELDGKAIVIAVEGLILGNYEFDVYASEKNRELQYFAISAENSPELERAVQEAVIVAESVNRARAWVNLPPSFCTPSYIAEEAQKIASALRIDITVLNRMHMQELGMGGMLAVARGSDQAPKLVVMKYYGNPGSSEMTAWVGKGVTYDSGGLSLKPAASLVKMKRDMSGAAAALAAVSAAARLNLGVNIMAVLPLCENMPNGNSLQPGDIIRMLNGKTVEIHSADAEGRLMLADAVTYAVHLGATRLVDIATLTGSCAQALGTIVSGLVDNNSEWCYQIVAASASADERVWRFPNYPEYKKMLKTPAADYKNTTGVAGAITGGLFVGEFTDNRPWVHIDIAGTAWADKAEGINACGATGVMVRTLVELARAGS